MSHPHHTQTAGSGPEEADVRDYQGDVKAHPVEGADDAILHRIGEGWKVLPA